MLTLFLLLILSFSYKYIYKDEMPQKWDELNIYNVN